MKTFQRLHIESNQPLAKFFAPIYPKPLHESRVKAEKSQNHPFAFPYLECAFSALKSRFLASSLLDASDLLRSFSVPSPLFLLISSLVYC